MTLNIGYVTLLWPYKNIRVTIPYLYPKFGSNWTSTFQMTENINLKLQNFV